MFRYVFAFFIYLNGSTLEKLYQYCLSTGTGITFPPLLVSFDNVQVPVSIKAHLDFVYRILFLLPILDSFFVLNTDTVYVFILFLVKFRLSYVIFICNLSLVFGDITQRRIYSSSIKNMSRHHCLFLAVMRPSCLNLITVSLLKYCNPPLPPHPPGAF